MDYTHSTVEGIYRDGKIELVGKVPVPVRDSTRVLVTFLPEEPKPKPEHRQIQYGQFAGEKGTGRLSTEEDFRLAEWRGEADPVDGD